MAISGPGMYGLTLEKMLIDTAGQSVEAETHKELMCTDSYTPNYDTDDFRVDVTNEVSGTNYSTGGVAVTTTEVTLSSGVLKFDAADTVYTNVTIAATAMAGVIYFNIGSSATDSLILLQDFVTAAGATAANFTIQHHANGILTVDYVP